MTYRTIVVGTDGSETAEIAVRHASWLAKDHDARLVIITAYEPRDDTLARSTHGVPDDIRWTLTDRAQAEEKAIEGRTLAAEAELAGVVAQAVAGSPADVLLEAAADFDAGNP